jgi:hypothetical protein
MFPLISGSRSPSPPVKAAAAGNGLPHSGASGRAGRILEAMKPTRAAPRRHLPGSPFNVPELEVPAEQYAVDDLVTHDKYGLGSVTGVDDADAVFVDFGLHKVRIALPCAKLFKL